MSDEDPSSRRALSGAEATLGAWLLLVPVHAAAIALLVDDAAPRKVRLLHHAFDAGHLLALGVVCAALAHVWRRFGAKGPLAAAVALWAVSFVAGAAFLAEDFVPRATRLAAGDSPAPWLVGMLALAAGTVPAAWAVGRRMRRPPFIALPLVVGALVAGANHMVLERNYPGVHLLVALVAAALVAAALTGLRVPRRLATRSRGRAVAVASALLGLASIVVAPPNAVRVRLAARSGSSLAPFVQRVHVWLATRSTRAVVEAAVERSERPATTPRLLPEDAVVVVVTIDALRGDLFDDPTVMARLPTLRALSEEARFFRRARTTAPATTVALTSMFRSRYFSQLRWEPADDGWTYAHRDPSPALPEVLGEGVRTLAVHGSPWLAPRHRVVGRVDEDVHVPAEGEEVDQQYVFAERLVERALEALAEEGAQLVFMHWLEAHAPYDRAGEAASPREGYLAELAIADRALGRLRAALHARWPRRGALVVASDHGEAFGEHATRHHGLTLYEEMVHVPLIVELPDAEPAVVDVPVSLIDVAPTIVDLFHRPIPGSFMGESLAPLLRGDPADVAWPERPIFIDGGRLVRALVSPDGYKLIRDRRLGTTELYDLSRDPGERNNLADALPVESAARLELMRSFFARHEHRGAGYTTPFRPP